MPAPKKLKRKPFENNKQTGSYVMISFEVFGEDDKKQQAHSFDANVHYYEKGEGKPLILVHGIGQSLFAWRNNIDCFADAGYRVIAIDMPGFGYSSQPNIYYTIEENASMLKSFTDALGIKKASFAGFSTGALSVLLMAHLYPETVEKLILASPGGPNESYPLLMRFLTTTIGHFAFKLRFTHFTLDRVLRELYFNKPLLTEHAVKQYYEPYKNKHTRDSLVMAMLHFEDHFDTAMLHSIKKDTLVVSAQNDPIHSIKTAEKFASIPGCEHKRLRNCGHFVNEEKPDIFNAEAIRFLELTESDKIFV